MTLPRVEVDNVPEIPGRHKQGSAIFGARRYPTLLSWRRAKSQAEKLDGGNVGRPRAADDFGAIRARMEELRRESARMPAHDHAAATRVGSCWFWAWRGGQPGVSRNEPQRHRWLSRAHHRERKPC